MPSAIAALVSLVLAERTCVTLAVTGRSSFGLVLAAIGCAVSLVSLLMASRSDSWEGRRHVLLACSACAAAVLIGALGSTAMVDAGTSTVTKLAGVPVSSCELEVTGDPTRSKDDWLVRAQARLPSGESCSVWVRGSERVGRGTTLRCVGRLSVAEDDEWGISSRRRGVFGTISVRHVLEIGPPSGVIGALEGVREGLVGTIDPGSSDGRALMCGCLLGWRESMSSSGLSDAFSSAGLAHLVAVSGSHLAIMASALEGALRRIGARPRLRAVVVCVATFCFVMLCGAPVSALRAWAMSVVASLAHLAGRRGHALTAVGLVGLAIAAADPFSAYDLGFLLSVTCVVSLCVFSTYASSVLSAFAGEMPSTVVALFPHRLRRLVGRGVRHVGDSLGSSVVAQVSCASLCAVTFSRLSLAGPVVNVVASPLFLMSMCVGLVSVAFSWVPVVGPAMLVVAGWSFESLAYVARLVSRLPLSCVAVEAPEWSCVAELFLGVLLYLWWPRPRGRVLRAGLLTISLVLVCLFVRWTLLVPARVVVLDIGQGDAILIQDGSSSLLVDTGPDSAIVEAMARNHVTRLDAVLLTHLHDDHVGGLDDLLGVVDVGEVIVGEGVSSSMSAELVSTVADLTGSDPVEVSYGDVLRISGFSFKVVWPHGPTEGDVNADSICLVMGWEGGMPALPWTRSDACLTGLLTGDAERDETDSIALAHDVGDVDFLKVGHHGSAVSISPGTADVLDAEVAVASAGEGNRYGHPTDECVSTLETSGSDFLCTKDVGDVILMPSARGPVVITQRPARA